MRTIGFIAGLVLVFGGAYISDKPEVVAYLVIQYSGIIGGGSAVVGLGILVVGTNWEKTP